MTELEKFKRRMIRMVARLHVQEKKPEDELWEYLRKQTKCDCKWLWERMRALTLKRLKRLLVAEDRQENIPAVARMSLTDWLLFDCILVHEKIDVIGQELIAGGRSTEPRPMFELFSLVQRFELEGLKGEQLARAWTAATVAYNSSGRQCSPMLLQRRWYQLKEVTRNKFYNFWFSYRGNPKLLVHALKKKPSRLQAAVARRYPHIIITPFLEWEDLIEKKLIIMPSEFEIQMKSRSNQLPKPIDENDSDLIMVEPEIETIDLRVDSDTDDDLRDEVEGSKATQMMANENIAAVQSITLKQEPIDEDYTEEGIDLDSAHMEAIDAEIDHMEGIEALENMEIPIQESTDFPIEEYPLPPPASNQKQPSKKKRGRPSKQKYPETVDFTEDEIRSSIEEDEASQENVKTVEDITSPTIEEIPSSPTEDEIKPELDESLTTKDVTSDPNISSTQTSLTNRVSPMAVITPKLEPTATEDPEITYIGDSDGTEPTEMPHITNVFGNVNIPDEALQKLSSYLENTKNATPVEEAENADDEIEEDIIKTEIVDDTNPKSQNVDVQIQNADVTANENNKIEIKNYAENPIDNLLGDVIPEVTFEDDGIEFIDDGIVEDEGEHVKDETKPETSQSIDLKLLMVPVVYTRKLEDMHVLKNKSIFHVKDIESIHLILAESKPESEKSIKINEEQPENKTIPDEEEDAHDDLFNEPDVANSADSTDSEEETIPEEKKVAISSVLFKKPRNRDYGPLIICKNPDFNTRLKRLTVGFLSYTRNRFLLRACKPLTIDLCKAFETKLVNNTVYLKQTSVSECKIKEEKPGMNDKNRLTPPIEPQENLVQANVAPTTSSVQNLIDNMHAEKLWSPPAVEPNKEVRRLEDNVIERNKVINLPNIDNVRRINQKLLVAEVSPMRVNDSRIKPPVSLLTQPMDKMNLPISDESFGVKTPETEVTSGKVICSGQVINNVSYMVRNYRGSKQKAIPLRPDAPSKVYRGFWNSKKSKPFFPQPNPFGEQLLTVDTLNKMLHIVNEKDPVRTHEKANYKKYNKTKQANELQKKVNEIQRMLTGESSGGTTDETQDKNKHSKGTSKQTQDESKPTIKNKKNLIKPKRGRPNILPETDRPRKRRKSNKSVDLTGYGYGTHCCWARFKQLYPESYNVHPCVGRCVCCCAEKRKAESDHPSIRKVCESIESVIEQSREIVDNEILDNEYLKNKDNPTQKDCAVKDVNNATESGKVAEENNVIDITDGENDAQEDNVKNNSAQNDNDECDIVVVDKNNIITTNDGNDTTGTLSVEDNNISNDSAQNTVVEDSVVAVNNTIPVVNQNQAETTDDCVLIDSDESDAQNLQPPPVRINVSYAHQDQPIRRRGRPIKTPVRIPPTPPFKTPMLQLELQKPNNRFNLRSISRKKDSESEKNVLFMKSTHIAKKSNHPIFLGKNKILLTDVPLLQNKNKLVETEPAPALINTSLPLPPGVNMMLLPNGVLTCSVDPNVQLSSEEIANLGLIVESVQKQINCAVSGVTVPGIQAVPTIQVPTMQVIPAMQPAPEIPAISVETESLNNAVNLLEDQNVVESSLGNNAQDKVSSVESEAAAESSKMENISSTTEDVVSARENVVSVTENVVLTTENEVSVSGSIVPASKTAVLATENAVSASESEVLASESADLATGNIVSSIDNANLSIDGVAIPSVELASTEGFIDQSSISEQTVQDPVVDVTTNNHVEIDKDKGSASEETNNASTSQAFEEEKRVETEPSKKKTILSDLMEMSGIFDEDIAPIAEPTQVVPEVPPPPLHIYNPCLPQLLTNSLPELTPITSFWELKYACSQNGNFFKLDLETKSLTPINVCIKKKASETPNQFVDLTEDDEENLLNVPKNKQVHKKMVETNLGPMPVFVIRKSKNNAQDTAKNISKERSVLKILEPAKPIKLFKVVHPFSPNVNLLQKQKKDAETSYDIVSAPHVMSKMGKRSRKQNLTEQVFETPTLNFLAAEGEKEDYEFDGSFEDTVESVDDSDSSDDEPLAKKVRRKEEMAKQAEQEILGPSASEATEANMDVSEPVEPTAAVAAPVNAQDESMESEVSELPLPEEAVDLPSEEQRQLVENEELEDVAGPTELQFLSDHDDNDEEDCILGF